MSDVTHDPESIVKYVVSTKLRCDSASVLQQKEAAVCPAQFDGAVCWLPTPVGTTALQPCPQFSQLSEEVVIVNRTCSETGGWMNVSGLDYGTMCGLDEMQLTMMEEAKSRLQTKESSSVVSEVRYHVMQLYQDCINKSRNTPAADGHCPIQFDGFSCWDQTPAGQIAQNPCPSFIAGFDPSRFAHRSCLANATWYRLPEQANSTLGWSNYTTCVDVDDLEFRLNVNSLYVCGYSISCMALFISLIIFLSFRSLNCTRILIHVHLFLSFAANNVMWVVWYLCVVESPDVIKKNEWPCQLLHVLLQYMMVANYMWMFCEGLHLHLALVVVFVKDEVAMMWFYFIGWGAPAAITLSYALARYYRREDETRQCWINESETQWILTVPVLMSLVASAIFLVNVVRVLLTKLHSNSAHPAPVGLRKAVRATLILVPLFGLHHMLIPVKPHRNEPAEYFYQVFAAIVVSLQGLCVSCLFCFANVDVHYAMRPFLRRACPCLRPGAALTDSGGACGVVNTQTQSRDVCV